MQVWFSIMDTKSYTFEGNLLAAIKKIGLYYIQTGRKFPYAQRFNTCNVYTQAKPCVGHKFHTG